MEEFLEDIGLERYAPRFAENDVHAIEDLPTKPSKLETVLDIVGITGNPGHLKKFRAALKDARANGGGGSAKRGRDDDGEMSRAMTGAPPPAGANDPAAAIKAAMAEAKARGGGIIGGSARPRRAPSPPRGWPRSRSVTPRTPCAPWRTARCGVNDIEAASDDESSACSSCTNRKIPIPPRLPGVWWTRTATWDKHPAMSTGTVALKLMALRLEPCGATGPRRRPSARSTPLGRCRGRIPEEDLDARRAGRPRTCWGEGDVEGGYVSMTGVHYAAAPRRRGGQLQGEDEALTAPRQSRRGRRRRRRRVRIKPSAAAWRRGRVGRRDHGGAASVASVPGEMRPRGEGEARVKVDLGGIRDKLKAAKKRPKFM